MFSPGPCILAVDVANLAHRAYHANKHLKTWGGKPSGHVYGSAKMLLALVDKFTRRGTRPELWFALDGRPVHRLKLYPEYKGNRGEREFEPVPAVDKLVRYFPGTVYSESQLEADDILSILTHKSYRENKELILVTTDRDLWRNVGRSGVRVYAKDHFVDQREMVATFGVSDRRAVTLVKAFFGDSSDNVKPAVPRMRKKPVLDVINEHRLRTLDDVKAHLSEFPSGIQIKLQEHWKDLRRNWRVVRLPLKPRDLNSSQGPKTPDKLVAYLERYQCKSLLEPAEKLWS